MKTDERVIRDKDNRDKTRDAMRSLLRFAQAKIESGVTGSLPFDEVQNAKEYFFTWRRRKMFESNKILGFFLSSAVLVFSFISKGFGIVGTILAIAFIFVAYSSLESDKSKKVYIREMLGDMSSMTYREQEMYLKGLRQDLWRVEEEKLKVVFAVVMFLCLIVSIVAGEILQKEVFKILAYVMAIGFALVFFSTDFIKTIKIHQKREICK